MPPPTETPSSPLALPAFHRYLLAGLRADIGYRVQIVALMIRANIYKTMDYFAYPQKP